MEVHTAGYKKLGNAAVQLPGAAWDLAKSAGRIGGNVLVGGGKTAGGAAVSVGGGVLGVANNVLDRGAGLFGGAMGALNRTARNPTGQVILLATAAFFSFKGIKSWFHNRKARNELAELRTNNDRMEMQLGAGGSNPFGSFDNPEAKMGHAARATQRPAPEMTR
jgi:hypothetical protein